MRENIQTSVNHSDLTIVKLLKILGKILSNLIFFKDCFMIIL